MPLPDDRGLIASLLEKLGECLLIAVELVAVAIEAVEV
jgi:hypothetical protein